MMLGTAASSSTATPMGRLSHTGASSVRKIAMPKLTGIASNSARNEVTSVPYIGASAPNWSVTGFHTSRVRKLNPKWANAGQAPTKSEMATPPSSASTSSAAAKVAPRKARSRRRCAAACAGSIAATVFITDGNLSRCSSPNQVRRPAPRQRFGAAAPPGSNRRNTLDLGLPRVPDLSDQAVGQRYVIELGGHLGTVLVCPVEEFQRRTGRGRVRRAAIHQNETRTGDRPALVPGLIGQNQMITGCMGPVGARGRCLERLGIGRHLLTGGVDEVGVRHLVLLREGIFDVADGAIGLRRHVGDALVALGTDAHWPLHRGIGTNRFLELRIRVGQEVRKQEVGPRPVRAVDGC